LGKRIQDKGEQPKTRFMLYAGAAQGITMGSVYDVHASNLISDFKHPNISLGVLVVSKVDALTSELSYTSGAAVFGIRRLFYCRLNTRAVEKLLLYCDDRAWLETIFPSDEREWLSLELVDDANAAALRLAIIEEGIHFERNDPMINPFIGSHLPHVIHRTNIALVREVIRCFIHFNYHLTRAGGDDFRNVYMELRRLKIAGSDKTLIPYGENLLEKELVVHELSSLGMTIHNGTDLPLYPYLFYFDPSDLDISMWHSFFQT
jgi:hypothetical protein